MKQYIAKFTAPNGTEFFWGPFDSLAKADDYCWHAKYQYKELGIDDKWKRKILMLNTPIR